MKIYSIALLFIIVGHSLVFAQPFDHSPHSVDDQYDRAVAQLRDPNAIGEKHIGANHGRAHRYFLKKWKYYRFLDNYIKMRKKALGAEGVSISVISKNDLLFLKGYGHADKASQRSVTPFTLFGVGSVSKVVTGIAIMQLVEKGLIDLDAPLETYIPGFSYKTRFPDSVPITVRTLMTHQSGLVGDILKGFSSVDGPGQNFRELVDILQDEYVAYPPGYISTYSNCAVSLLGIVIEEVSGVAFQQYIKRNICMPLGMVTSKSHPNFFHAGRYMGHSGAISHYYTQMHFLPEHGLAVIVETNSETGSQLSMDVADMAMVKALEIFKGIRRPPANEPVRPVVQLTENHVLQMEGTYATKFFCALSIYPDNGRLLLSSPVIGQDLELIPHEDNWFSFYLNDQPAPGFENIRITIRQGEVERFIGLELRFEQGGIYSSAIGAEYPLPQILPPEWIGRQGKKYERDDSGRELSG